MSNYLRLGYLEKSDLTNNFPLWSVMEKHAVAMAECLQEIPCNPCVTSCATGAITMANINAIPEVNFEKCIGCGKCVAVCPGLAMFMVKVDEGGGEITLPYEMLPQPEKGESINLLNRSGENIGKGTVLKVVALEKSTHSVLVTVAFTNSELVYDVRNIEVKR